MDQDKNVKKEMEYIRDMMEKNTDSFDDLTDEKNVLLLDNSHKISSEKQKAQEIKNPNVEKMLLELRSDLNGVIQKLDIIIKKTIKKSSGS